MDEYQQIYNSTDNGNSLPSESRDYLHVYSILTCGLVLVSCLETATYAIFTTIAARNLHNKMFYRVLRAPMAFFECNPVGKIR